MSAKEYPVATLMDMARIPAEALPRFLAELPDLIGMSRPIVALVDASGGTLNLEIPAVWVDDGDTKFTASVEVNGEELFTASGKFPKGGAA